MIKNLVFDFGKVLVDHDLRPFVDRFFANDVMGRKRFIEILSDKEFINKRDRGERSFGEMMDEAVARYPEFSEALLFFKSNCLDEVTGEIPGMRPLLEKLRGAGFRLYGLTNWSDTIYGVLEKFEIFRLLDGMVISCEEHMIKPEKGIYTRLCEKYGLLPEECLFTDDRMENIDGAREAGMDAVVFTTPEDYARYLSGIISSQV